MLSYLNRNLKNLFTKQRLLSLLLVLNIIVSCLVICFSYGLYQNYNMILIQGEQEESNDLDVLIKEENTISPVENTEYKLASDISPTMLIEMLHALSDDTKNNIDTVVVEFFVDSPLSEDTTNNQETEFQQQYYSDDDDPFYMLIKCMFTIEGDKFIDVTGYGNQFTVEQYNNGEKVAIVLDKLYDTHSTTGEAFMSCDLSWRYRALPEGTDSIIIGGEEYEIIKTLPREEMGKNVVHIPLTSIPEDAKVLNHYFDYTSKTDRCLSLFFKEPVTRKQYEDIKNCLSYLGEDVFLEEIEFTEATEIYYYKTIMLISVVIAVLAAINMAILYRYILEKRSSELAIFRICGCSKAKAIFSYLLECMVINIPLFALTQLCYHKLIMPRLTGLFPNMAGAYSLKLYLAIFCIYIVVSTLVMLIMIAVAIKGHSLVALKSAHKATNRFGIMKVFEILQLAIVLSMLVLIVSAIISRYSLFTPFEPYLERKGYLVESTNGTMYPENFEEIIGDAEYIMNQNGSFAVGDLDTDDYIYFGGVIYSDEFVESYAPPMQEGVWLSDTDETYENSGYIPAVITSCGGRYKVGDVIEQDYELDWVDDQPTRIVHAKYKIVGILADKVSVASYMMGGSGEPLPNKDYRDIYNVFSDDFEEDDYLLRKISDEYACFNSSSTVWGIQFVFCDNMSDEEYEELGKKLNAAFAAVPLSEVRKNSLDYIYEQMYTLFPIAACIFILTIISTVSISAIYTKRQLRNYAIFYICGARWRTCALKSLKNGAITCSISAALSALILVIGKATILKETVISFGMWHLAVCVGVIVLYLVLSMIMPLSIIGSAEPREVLKEE